MYGKRVRNPFALANADTKKSPPLLVHVRWPSASGKSRCFSIFWGFPIFVVVVARARDVIAYDEIIRPTALCADLRRGDESAFRPIREGLCGQVCAKNTKCNFKA